MKISRCILLLPLVALNSCLIENDMSYPRVSADFTSFAVSGQESVTIDTQAKAVQVVLSETADITALEVTEIGFTDMTLCSPELAVGSVIDLSQPYKVTLSIYQDYEWTISATQPIERYINCTNQIGDAELDAEKKQAIVRIAVADEQDSQALQSVVFNSMKLEPEGAGFLGYVDNSSGTEEVKSFEFPLTLDCTLTRTFVVKYGDEQIRWDVNVMPEEVEMAVTSVIPWCYSADIEGLFDGNGTPYLEYRTGSESTWTRASDEVTVSGTALSAKLTGLTEGTAYYVRFSTSDKSGEEYTFTTGTPVQIDNMGFDDWYANDSGTWFPNLNETVKIWDTANRGAAILRKNPTTPEYDHLATDDPDNKAAARLESMNVMMFAAGNLYTGLFQTASFTGGIGAILDWGVPFTGRPCALKGYYRYNPQKIDNVKAPYENLEGTMDNCQILVILTDWSAPFTVDTAQGIFVDQTKENDSIIAYGKMESEEDTGDEYREFTLDLEYWRPDATPAYAVVVVCASYKGDYFTGGIGSTMYVDEFEFVYD